MKSSDFGTVALASRLGGRPFAGIDKAALRLRDALLNPDNPVLSGDQFRSLLDLLRSRYPGVDAWVPRSAREDYQRTLLDAYIRRIFQAVLHDNKLGAFAEKYSYKDE